MATQVASSVLDRSRPESRRVWEASFDIDQNDPFFFDHPLDHAPAMLLLETVLRTAERAADESSEVVAERHLARLRLEFGRFCELTPAPVVQVRADADQSGRWDVELRQDGAVIATGELGWRPRIWVAPDPADRPQTLPEPSPPHLVHRWRPENVLVGGLTKVATGAFQIGVLPPPPGHYFRRRDGHFRPVGELIESARQFGTLLGHMACNVRLGMQFVVQSLAVELTRQVTRDEWITILAPSLPALRGGRGKWSLTVVIRAGDETVGTAAMDGSVFSAEAFARIRGRSGK
ncbi:MAG TPA: AfsA-related hotdog domain-containing protein [Pseudonocardiaceae bacterium]|nr:AfsA-related hotdog domain-containing protein [Pseudonocardiaceae bacterium]